MPYQDIDRRRAYGREWMRRNPDKARDGMRRWRANHPDEHRAETISYHARHRERISARNLACQRATREAYRVLKNNYRVRRQRAGSFSEEFRSRLAAEAAKLMTPPDAAG